MPPLYALALDLSASNCARHRDLAARNVLLDMHELRGAIADFGLTRYMNEG